MIIGAEFTYVGDGHSWAKGLRVRVVAVIRGGVDGRLLRDDAEIGALQPDDIVEFAPWVKEAGRFSWVTSDCHPWELEPLR